MFDTILIANRGEIACRVIRTARKLGIRTVAVFSEADRHAQHVKLADEAVLIGEAAAKDSYLRADRIIEAAKSTGAEAIHPGYGFLSENAHFADACQSNDIVFIGPPGDAIRSMGSKSGAKAIMGKAGVPLVPGYHGDEQDPEHLAAQADAVGYPVLIKASSGGGGKGMRLVHEPAEFAAALQSCKREALNSFGDDHVLIERFVTRPRHIEIQVFADSQGNAVHLYERDCSLQRRHQKVIEESPAPLFPIEMREAMGKAAIAAAKAIGYVGAGTVEFIASSDPDGSPGDFFFMEMNTRLQVEHPVTEMVTGQDLVEWQLRVASGQPLPMGQADIPLKGHAFEARLYAEEPANGFLPSTGQLLRYRTPTPSEAVRIDSGIIEGDEVTVHYDPMIAKLIVHGPTRALALTQLRRVLEQTELAGLASNRDFLHALCRDPDFAAGIVDTGLIERRGEDLLAPDGPVDATIILLAAIAELQGWEAARHEQAAASGDASSPWFALQGWRLNDRSYSMVGFRAEGEDITIRCQYTDFGYDLTLRDQLYQVRSVDVEDGRVRAEVDGRRAQGVVVSDGGKRSVITPTRTLVIDHVDLLAGSEASEDQSGRTLSPMPGKVTQVFVKAGQQVEKGASLLVLEAMKMEHTITAPMDGVVSEVFFNKGDQVDEGVDLIAIEDAD